MADVDINAEVPIEQLKLPLPSEGGPQQPAEIGFSDFEKVDLRIGTVKIAERVPKTDKLIQRQVGFGSFERQIVAGVGKTHAPEDLIGKQFVFVVNLAPRKLRGVESHGMMLAAAGGGEKGLALIQPDGLTPDGMTVG